MIQVHVQDKKEVNEMEILSNHEEKSFSVLICLALSKRVLYECIIKYLPG